MDFLKKIEPHLISNDLLIQETVLHALHDFPNVPHEWTVELLNEAFRNKEKQPSILIYIDNQPINEEALNILLDNIPKMDNSNKHLALNLLDNVETELALSYRQQLETYIGKDQWTLYELIQNGTREQVYSEFAKRIRALEKASSFNHDEYIQVKKLAQCIVHNNWITEEQIDHVMERELNDDWISFEGILTVYMIGLLKLEKYIPVLASLLNRDDDILLEETSAALIGFQSDEVVKVVEPYIIDQDAVIYAASVVENIKTDLAVLALRKAYRKSKEDDVQDLIFEALCHQFSKAALPEITAHIEEKEYFTTLVDIEQVVYGYFSIMGEHHPDLELWRQGAMESEMDFRNNSASVSNEPIRNENKIGRNDPCPCGSGKKYKKCCG